MDKDKEHSLLLTHHIKPDYGFYVTGDDRLYVAAYSSVASLLVRFSGYFLDAKGDINHYAVDVTPTSDRALTTSVAYLGEGFVLSCIATIITGSANRGQCYVRARIQRGAGANLVPVAQLLGGYVTDDYSPSFPHGTIEGPLEGAGMLRSITGTNPPVFTDISETVPTGARWRLLSFRFTLVTDGNAANRTPTVLIDDGTTTLIAWGNNNVPQTATITKTYDVRSPGFADTLTSTQGVIWAMALLPLAAGFRIRTSTNSLQAGDDYGAPQYLVEEWIEA